MDKKELQEILGQTYNQENWKKIVQFVFPNVSILATPKEFPVKNDKIKSFKQLGSVHLNDGKNLALFELLLYDSVNIHRNRVELNNEISKYIDQEQIHGVLSVFEQGAEDYRFTFSARSTEFDEDSSDFIQRKTDTKRYTYVLGKNESCKTPAERFYNLSEKKYQIDIELIQNAFSVEQLSKEFFDKYKKQFEKFYTFIVNNEKYSEISFGIEREKGIRDFVKQLLGRIVFLYFLQKKGWMGCKAHLNGWVDGDKQFMQSLFENFSNPSEFNSKCLSELFHNTLNKKRHNDIFSCIGLNGILNRSKVPYLNGGLFDSNEDLTRKIDYPVSYFRELLDFFGQYNFTIDENEPNDHEVGIAPEMLGHIFENLLEDNKDKGAYYTPKEIVHYMCQESLIEYLCTSLQIEPEDLERVAVSNLLKQKVVDEILRNEIININKALDNVKICDPAIGSGAFPMGLLHEIFTAKQTLHTFEFGNSIAFDASFVKLNIIQNSIYGVDIEKGAVEIARLRFWLSLIVDEQVPKALPNLDYKIVVGNSLVSKFGEEIVDINWSLNETSHGLFGAELVKQKGYLLKKISQEQKEFFNPDSDKDKLKAEIRKLKIDLLITQLDLMVKTKGIETKPSGTGKVIGRQTEQYVQTIGWKNSINELEKLKKQSALPLNFFDWKLDFPEVMNEYVSSNVGFDIVIGNPPYVRQERLGLELKEILKKFFPKVANGTADLYVYFFNAGVELLKEKGVLSYITLNKYLKTKYGLELRKMLASEYDVDIIIDFFELPVFEASTDACITKILNTQLNKETKYFPIKSLDKLDLFEITEGYYQKVIKDETEWKFIDDSQQSILDKIYSNTITLKDFCQDKIYRGITTGLNEAFVLDKDVAKKLLNTESEKIVIPYAKSTDIKQWSILDEDKYFLATGYDTDVKNLYPSAFNYLQQFEQQLKVRQDKGRNWWNLRACKYYPDFAKNKIIYMHTAKKHEFYYDTQGRYINNSCYMIISESKFLFSFLNSKLFEWLKKIKFVAYGDAAESGRVKLDYNKMISVPIKKSNKAIENLFEVKINEINEKIANGKDTSTLLAEIDNLVYKLYELDYEEVKVIDPEFSLDEKEYELLKL